MSVFSVLEWTVWSISLLGGLWFALGIRQTAVHNVAPPTWPTLILSLALVAFPGMFLFLPFSKFHIIWLLAITWPLSFIAGVGYIPIVSKLLIWPAYVYACFLVVGTGMSLSSPSRQSPWAAPRAGISPPQSPLAGLTISDNFEYIALNMALIQCVLRSDHAHRFADEESLVVTCGVLDTLQHIQDGHFTVQDVKDALTFAKQGKCSLGSTIIAVGGMEDQIRTLHGGQPDLFLNYTLQIEAMCFRAVERFVDPSSLSDRDIIMAVLDNKGNIERVLGTLQPARNEVISRVHDLVAAFMGSSSFGDIRSEIGLK